MRRLASRIGLIVDPIVTGVVVQSLGYLAAFVASAVICVVPAMPFGIDRRTLVRYLRSEPRFLLRRITRWPYHLRYPGFPSQAPVCSFFMGTPPA